MSGILPPQSIPQDARVNIASRRVRVSMPRQTSRAAWTMASTNLHFIRSSDIEISLRMTASSQPSSPPLVVRRSSLFCSPSSSGNPPFPEVSWNSYKSQIRVHEVWTGADDLDGRPEGAMDVHEPPPPLLATVISIFFSASVVVIVVIITPRNLSHCAHRILPSSTHSRVSSSNITTCSACSTARRSITSCTSMPNHSSLS